MAKTHSTEEEARNFDALSSQFMNILEKNQETLMKMMEAPQQTLASMMDPSSNESQLTSK